MNAPAREETRKDPEILESLPCDDRRRSFSTRDYTIEFTHMYICTYRMIITLNSFKLLYMIKLIYKKH